MAIYKHLRSSTANKRPTTSIADGQLAINTNTASPGLFFKDSAGTGIVKVGPVHVGTTAPNVSPAAGGSSGNYTGEQWLDTSVSPNQMKVWNGSAWVGIVADELPVSKLQDGTAGQIIQTDSAGTGVEWSSTTNLPIGSAGAPAYSFQSDSNTGIYSPGADQVAISTAGTGRLFVDASGRVGIGTTSPSSNLVVSNGSNKNIEFQPGSTGYLFAYDRIAGDYLDLDIAGQIVRFSTDNGTERLRITSDGKIGIGTSSPASLLTSYPGNVSTLGAKASTGLLVENNGSAGNISQIGLGYTFSGTYHPVVIAAITDSGSGSTRADLHFATRSLTTDSAPDTRMIIKSDGKVGIGTAGPVNRLEIAGTTANVGLDGTGNTYISFLKSAANIGYVGDANWTFGGSSSDFGVRATSNLVFGIGANERARIDSSGRLLVGTSTDTGGALLQVNDNRIRIATAKTPASATDTGSTGEICWDASYIYVCTATNTWKRTAITTW